MKVSRIFVDRFDSVLIRCMQQSVFMYSKTCIIVDSYGQHLGVSAIFKLISRVQELRYLDYLNGIL